MSSLKMESSLRLKLDLVHVENYDTLLILQNLGGNILELVNFSAMISTCLIACKRHQRHPDAHPPVKDLGMQLPGIYWWRNTKSGAAELTAGFYSVNCRDGYSPIASMLKKREAALNFTCLELHTVDQKKDFPQALADPEGLVWQVLNAAWVANIPVAGENARPCYHREGYNKILENANDPFGRYYLSAAFTYLRLSPTLLVKHNFMEFERFVQMMHGVQRNNLN